MTPRIQKAIDILLDALNNGTLERGLCSKCAVGNLVAAGMIEEGVTSFIHEANIYSIGEVSNTDWASLFITDWGVQRIRNVNDKSGLKAISYTDFSWEELAQIEFAFETNTTHFEYTLLDEIIRKDQIKGLEAVVKVMLSFDEQSDDVKEVFTSKAELIPV